MDAGISAGVRPRGFRDDDPCRRTSVGYRVVIRCKPSPTRPRRSTCAGDNGRITLPLGSAQLCSRTISVTPAPRGGPQRDSTEHLGRYYGNDTRLGQFPGCCRTPMATAGPTPTSLRQRRRQGAGGTGIAIYKGALRGVNDRILRYALPSGGIAPTTAPRSSSRACADRRSSIHPFAIVQGNLYVDLGSATNSEALNRAQLSGLSRAPSSRRAAGSGAMTPTARARFSRPSAALGAQRRRHRVRLRGQDLCDPARPGSAGGKLAPSIGRSKAPTTGGGLVLLERGADYGWPGVPRRNRSWCWPEYSDGGHAVGPCAQHTRRRGLPAHWAPNDLALYNGRQFPTASGVCVHRVSRLLESCAISARRLQHRVPAAGRRQGIREVRGVRRRVCRRGQGSGPGRAPAFGPRGRTRRRTLHIRRRAWAHLARDVPGRCRDRNPASTRTADCRCGPPPECAAAGRHSS